MAHLFSLVGIFFTSLLIAYTGALAPGPMLTYAVGQSARRGFIAGPLIVAGHAVLEIVVVVAIAFGALSAIGQDWVIEIISLAGGSVILVMGIAMIASRRREVLVVAGARPSDARGEAGSPRSRRRWLGVIAGGAAVSIANPYWSLWWLGVAAAYFKLVSAHGVAGYAAFFAGHIVADLTWYGFVAYVVASGRKWFSAAFYRRLILVSGVFLLGLGAAFIWIGVS